MASAIPDMGAAEIRAYLAHLAIDRNSRIDTEWRAQRPALPLPPRAAH